MAWVRIYSTMIDDGNHEADEKEVIVLQVRLNENHTIDTEMQAFGYIEEYSEDTNTYLKYPFILQFESKKENMAKLDYGGWDTETTAKINILTKHIKNNETFTLFADSEYIYRIEQVTQI